MFFGNGISDILILSFFYDMVLQLTLLIHGSYLIIELELLHGYTRFNIIPIWDVTSVV